MLLRAYRLTDKFGIIILKLSTAVGHWLLMSARSIISVGGVAGRGGAALIGVLVGLLWTIISGVLRAGRWLVERLFRLFRQGAGQASVVTGQAARSIGSSVSDVASDAMARRAARDEIDKVVVEDPLLVQNRRLSALVLILGILVIGAVIWATDNQSTASPIMSNNPGNSLFLQSTAQPTDSAASVASIATPIPTATQIPAALRVRGTIAYTVRERGQTDIWAVGVGSTDAIRLTNDPADERDPAWSPDGTRLAYASRQDGNWEIYVYAPALERGPDNPQRITFDLAFQANPTWSPDGAFLAYESYQGNDLDIMAVPIDGSTSPYQITGENDPNEVPDFSPAWSPADGGRQIAFVSWRDGNQDIYIFNLDTLEITNLTQTPNRNEDHPAWSPDGQQISFSALEQGREKVFVMPVDEPGGAATVVSFGRTPSWSPDGGSLAFAVDATDGTQTYLYADPVGREGGVATEVLPAMYGATAPDWSDQALPPQLVNAGGLSLAAEPLYEEQFRETDDGAPYRLASLPNVQAEQAFLSTRVDDSFNAWRDAVELASGTDFLGRLDDAFWALDRQPEPGEPRRNWHKTGRAVAVSRNAILGFPPLIEVVKEDIGVNTYWRVFLRVDEDQQAGQLGEPLRTMPWDFLSATQSDDVEAYNQGGRLRREVPSGYYVDLTQLAQDYGWDRLPASTDWRANVRGRNYWLFVNHDNLTWYEAMQEIHTEGELVNFSPEPQEQ